MRARRWTIRFLLVASAVAIVATSPPTSETSSEQFSGRVLLTREQPEVRLPFTAEVSDDALDHGQYGLGVWLDVTWEGVDPVSRPQLDVSVEWPGGTLRDFVGYPFIECRVECSGPGEVVLRWPAELTDGEAAVAWLMRARQPVSCFG